MIPGFIRWFHITIHIQVSSAETAVTTTSFFFFIFFSQRGVKTKLMDDGGDSGRIGLDETTLTE
jgi:hypothetical protein